MKNNYPRVSIVIPCWNAESFISDAIRSCLLQEYDNLEVIVVNDGSTDGSMSIIRDFDDQVISISVENGGAPKARNKGLSSATGQYVIFLDADDYIEGDFIHSLVHEMNKIDAHLGFAPWVKVKDGIDLMPTKEQRILNWREMFITWLLGEYTPPMSVMWNKQLLLRIGGWDEQLSKNQDGDIVLRGLLEKPILAFSNVGRGVYRQHDSPFRVSNAGTKKTHVSSSIIFQKLVCWSDKNTDQEIRRSIGLYAYGMASHMFENSEPRLGDVWQQRARKMGVSNASNTKVGTFVGLLVGLKYKTYIRLWFSRLRSALNW
jgi:glycosyltransferase involved in cell wall biosynthesis